ncbi:fatty acid desaturase [Temperatibacter marinus]|uniref:Fatty acid desaturase n=1 Tax=Temperatibacter marinus TaxID=1456591 RepID=A0AA52H9X6_9PROT|nr:fatty acid desaturase [Temperatibacter marinus]WND03007.1 fatty acid desaturase [Temperatibacter marinus]
MSLPSKSDDPKLFKMLLKRPSIAWPTLLLLVSAYGIFSLTLLAYSDAALSLPWVILWNSIASYMAFTVAHDGTHNAISTNQHVNDWAGRAAIALLEPGPFFKVFRFIHMRHHQYTNDPEKDPDTYCGHGPAWVMPLRWLSLDVIYFKTYLQKENFSKSKKAEKIEFFLCLIFAILVISTVTLLGLLEAYLLLFFIPTRIAKLFIVFGFDFLPHYPHKITVKENRYQCTSNRVGLEWLLTPLFISQNYHLVHHIYPSVPFYRYLKIWNARLDYHNAKKPAITDTFAITPKVKNNT